MNFPGGQKRKYDWDVSQARSAAGSPSYQTPGTPGKRAKFTPPQPQASKQHIGTTFTLIASVLKEQKGQPLRPDFIQTKLLTKYGRNVELTYEMIEELIKVQEDVKFNEKNGTLFYQTKYDLSSVAKLEEYIRMNSAKPGGVSFKFIKEHWQASSTDSEKLANVLTKLEHDGKILIMRGPGADQGTLPTPGSVAKKLKHLQGYDAVKQGYMDQGVKNWRGVFWDHARENKEAPVGRLDPEYTQMWAKVNIGAKEDIGELLSKLGHKVSEIEAAKKTAVRAPQKKKAVKKQREAKKLTNTHLLALGIDLSKDYVPEG